MQIGGAKFRVGLCPHAQAIAFPRRSAGYPVAGLARDAELTAYIRHRLAIMQMGDKAQAFFHNRTLFLWAPHLPPENGKKCIPCVRYEMSPISRAAQALAALSFKNQADTLFERAQPSVFQFIPDFQKR